MSNTLDPDQDGHSVGPDLAPNCSQSLSLDNKNQSHERVHSMPTSVEYCRLLITFANWLDPDKALQNVGPDVNPNC